MVNPAKLRLIAESRRKTDKVDAKILCELLRLDGLPHPVHMPSAPARALRGLLTARWQLLAARTKLCNLVRGMLRQEGVRLPARELCSVAAWQRLFDRSFEQKHVGRVTAAYYDTLLALTKSIHDLDEQLAEAEQDPRVQRLKTMPKVGRIALLTFLAAVDDVHRFPTSRKLVGYSGLAPTVRQSGERTVYGAISREGRRELRAVWVQIAHLAAAHKTMASQPLRTWFNRVAKKRGKRTAVAALARRLLVIAYQLLKIETDFNAARLTKKRPAV